MSSCQINEKNNRKPQVDVNKIILISLYTSPTMINKLTESRIYWMKV